MIDIEDRMNQLTEEDRELTETAEVLFNFREAMDIEGIRNILWQVNHQAKKQYQSYLASLTPEKVREEVKTILRPHLPPAMVELLAKQICQLEPKPDMDLAFELREAIRNNVSEDELSYPRISALVLKTILPIVARTASILEAEYDEMARIREEVAYQQGWESAERKKDAECQARVERLKKEIEEMPMGTLTKPGWWQDFWEREGIV